MVASGGTERTSGLVGNRLALTGAVMYLLEWGGDHRVTLTVSRVGRLADMCDKEHGHDQ